jgi:hypothetical protein
MEMQMRLILSTIGLLAISGASLCTAAQDRARGLDYQSIGESVLDRVAATHTGIPGLYTTIELLPRIGNDDRSYGHRCHRTGMGSEYGC